MSSPRKVALDTVKALAKKVRSGAYFVKRGAINWTTWDFEKHPRAISIQLDRVTLFKVNGMNDGVITLEMFSRMSSKEVPPEIDDGVMDELLEDAEAIFLGLMSAEDKQGDSVVTKLEQDSTEVVESHDTSLRVQGIVVTVPVTF